MYNAEILADSVFDNGARVTTMCITLPKFLLAELNTHRMKSSNAASSRAIPVEKVMTQVESFPFVPHFQKNARGMQSKEDLGAEVLQTSTEIWHQAREDSLKHAGRLEEEQVHKQFVNRLLEPWTWADVIISMTDWDNFFALRTDEAAEPHFRIVAKLMQHELKESYPRHLTQDQWHMPFRSPQNITKQQWEHSYSEIVAYLANQFQISQDEAEIKYPKERFETRLDQDIAVGRICKVSYKNHATGKIDLLGDVRLAVMLSTSFPGHWSPFEHVCRQAEPSEMSYKIAQLEIVQSHWEAQHIAPIEGKLGYCGNFKGVFQYRKEFPNENITKVGK